MERARRFERPTPTLARLCSTPELRPLGALPNNDRVLPSSEEAAQLAWDCAGSKGKRGNQSGLSEVSPTAASAAMPHAIS